MLKSPLKSSSVILSMKPPGIKALFPQVHDQGDVAKADDAAESRQRGPAESHEHRHQESRCRVEVEKISP
jgi:hypothetical protein